MSADYSRVVFWRDWNFRQKPSGLWAQMLHLPVYLFRLHLGFLTGDRILLLTHIGRTSGRTYETPVEVVEHDQRVREYIVCSGTGPNADWYRNLMAHPAVKIQVGNRRWRPTQRFLTQQEASLRFRRYEARHPRTAAGLLTSMGNSYDGTDRGRFEMMARMPMVAFSERSV
jgi:deazaflavin-dependent oxidoreductase (nitroreductase family)